MRGSPCGPRILDDAAIADLTKRLGRKDRGAPWTRRVLEIIEARPETVSTELAEALDMERLQFKRRVRQLKELGLTESLERGYRLSPRGEAWLAHLRA